MALELKDGSVQPVDLHPKLTWAIFQAERVYFKHDKRMVITSLNDGKHMQGSKHYEGKAMDLRIWGLESKLEQVKKELQDALGKDFDVVLEGDHFHIEYDPK